MTAGKAHAKINLALVVGPLRPDGKHEVVTVLERIGLHDDVALESASETTVEGFSEDTIVRAGLHALARAANLDHGWAVRIEKRIPVAAGLAGGSADAATALELANATLEAPVATAQLHAIAAELGADVPFFLRSGAQLGTGDGTALTPLALPKNYIVVLLTPEAVSKESTRLVYEAFDERDGARGFDDRARHVRELVASIAVADQLAALPPNDLARSSVSEELLALGAFRADVSGAGPTVYGLFHDEAQARRAEEALRPRGRTFVTHPV